jgi:hypothetical protein
MATLINKGWVYLTNDTDIMKLAAEFVEYDWIWDPEISHFEGGDNHYGYDSLKRYFVVKIKRFLFDSKSDAETYKSNLATWQSAGTFKIKIQDKSTPTYEKFDGTNTTLPVLSYGPRGNRKIEPGDGETYEIRNQVFEQAGSISA